MRFEELNLIEPLLRAVHSEGYTEPTPIQQQAIPHVLTGRDLLGCAQTGTGKTAAFALPILQQMAHTPRRDRYIRTLVLAPTRELATQIGESFRAYGRNLNFKTAVIFGGVGQSPQVDTLRRGVDILVATPGRLLDLMGQGYINLNRIEILVLDEADRMLDMGFIHDVRKVIAAVPRQRQTLLFSATMPAEIQELANNILNKPEYVAVTPVASTVELIQQSVYFVEKKEKPALLQSLLRDKSIRRVLVFTRTKHGANKVVQQLSRVSVQAEAIHGNKSQSARERALANFKNGTTRVLVATDIAARGIDVEDITHVINYDLPNEPETYVHRIGRTARAGASGVAIAFCDTEEREYLRDIERLIQLHIPRVENHDFASPLPPPPITDLTRGRGARPQSRPSNSGNGQRQQSRSFHANNGRPAGQGSSLVNANGETSANKRRRRRRRKPAQRETAL
jgi:ATP-dependent RNA helicase RhlE